MRGLEREEAVGLPFQHLIEAVRDRAKALQIAAEEKEDRSGPARAFFRALEILAYRIGVEGMDPVSRRSSLPRAHNDVPSDIWMMLYEQFSHLAVGSIPGPIRDCEGKGVKEPGAVERKDILTAVAYICASKRGLLRPGDPTPIKTISDLYGVHKRTAQLWIKRFPVEDPAPFCDGRFDLMRERIAFAADRYRSAGRSHAAVRLRNQPARGAKATP